MSSIPAFMSCGFFIRTLGDTKDHRPLYVFEVGTAVTVLVAISRPITLKTWLEPRLRFGCSAVPTRKAAESGDL